MGHPSDLPRLLGNAIQLGVVASVDLDRATCTVRLGQIVTGDVPWLAGRAGGTSAWSPPTVGEQCLLLCPEGDIAAGVALLGLYSNAQPAPSAEADLDLIAFSDGATLRYDAAAHVLRAELPEGARVEIEAPAGVLIVAPGGVRVDGSISATDNLRAGNGATGTFTTGTGGTVTVQGGIVTRIDG